MEHIFINQTQLRVLNCRTLFMSHYICLCTLEKYAIDVASRSDAVRAT